MLVTNSEYSTTKTLISVYYNNGEDKFSYKLNSLAFNALDGKIR